MDKLVEHIICIANKEIGGINKLVLNKVLCLSFRDFYRIHGENEQIKTLNDGGFELWAYGLTHKTTFYKYWINGRRKITDEVKYHSELSDFDDFIKKWLQTDLNDLITESQNHYLWRENIKSIMTGKTIGISLKTL